jgi:signal peptidase I
VTWVLAAGLGAVALIVGIGLWARGRLVLVTVVGSSMEPTLFPSDRVLVHRRGLARVRRGQLVVLGPPSPDGIRCVDAAGASLDRHLWNIKRAVALPGDPVPPGVTKVGDAECVPQGALVVLGDNASSTDSRQRGFYFADDLLGVVVRRMSTVPARTGWARAKPK